MSMEADYDYLDAEHVRVGRTRWQDARYAHPSCPKCGREAKATQTRYGVRHDCCDLHSWHGRPLVDQATHDRRRTDMEEAA